MSVAEGALLLVTGVVAGVVSVVVSLASLVSYPVLLAVGLSPLSANVTNTVALVFTAIGSAAGSRQELTGQGRLLARLGWLTAVGGAVGAAVLLLTPPGSFEAVVPWLVGGASLVLLVQPTITRRQPVGPSGDPDAGAHGPVMVTALFAVAGYVGYFGAAGGVLMLAVLTPMLRQSAARTIAVKNAISGAANAVAAIGFALFGPVRWSAAAPLAAGFLLGGRLGPAAVRRLPDRGLQVAIGVCGLAMAAKLGMDSYR